MYQFFHQALGKSTPDAEPEIRLEEDETLACLPRGQIADIPSQIVFGFTKAKSEALRTDRKPLPVEELQRALADLLKLPQRQGPPRYRIFRPLSDRKYPLAHATQYGIETEPGILALVTRLSDQPHVSRPSRTGGKCLLYVSHQSADAELREEPLLRELIRAEPDSGIFAVDLRGIGDSQPDTCGKDTFLKPYGSDYFYAAHAIMLDRPYPGMRTHDLLTVLDWLKDVGYAEIHLVARGWGAIPGTFAAVLSPQVTQVTLKHSLTSYAEIAETEDYAWPLSAFVPGILKQCDLPDCYRVLEQKRLRQIEPWGPRLGG
jgi:hypothetical protein